MPQLLFKKPFKAAILAGRKTTTLRRWQKCTLRVGDSVNVQGVGALILKAVEPVQWEQLTDADAKADGFASLADLNKTIRRIYPNLDDDGKAWFKLTFRLAPAAPRARLAAALRAELERAVGSLGLRSEDCPRRAESSRRQSSDLPTSDLPA